MKKTIVVTLGILLVVALTLAIIPATRDEIHWRWVSHKAEMSSYEDYIKAWPEGRHATKAKDNIESLHWQEATMRNTVQSFEWFLQLHGEGKHVTEARDNIESLHREVQELIDKGVAVFDQDKMADALDYFSRALRIDPRNTVAIANKCAVFHKRNQDPEVLQCVEEYIKVYPLDAKIWNHKGAALARLERFFEALDAFNTAEKIDPQYTQTLFNRGNLYLEMGDYRAALTDFETAKSKGISSDPTADINITWCKLLLRQLDGTNLPPPDWKPDRSNIGYLKFKAEGKPYRPLIEFAAEFGAPAKSHASEGWRATIGWAGMEVFFQGSEAAPHVYAFSFYVWAGSVISDIKWGVLLDNGTSFKYVHFMRNQRVERLGVVKDWKFVFTSETRTDYSQQEHASEQQKGSSP